MNIYHRKIKNRTPRFESLEARAMLAADVAGIWHNTAFPEDVNSDTVASAIDALLVINYMNTVGSSPLSGVGGEGSGPVNKIDVSADGWVTPLDALLVINRLNAEGAGPSDADRRDPTFNARLKATLNPAEQLGPQNLLEAEEVRILLERASQASPSKDAIIAVVDRVGRIVGVRVEAGVSAALQADPNKLSFAIDGAVAKARTAAFFSSNEAPLTSRTIRFISQTTNTQREVESSPLNPDPNYQGPGFVAPIGVGGHFPPEISFTPQVDLFAIEHQSRDRQLLDLGGDLVFGTADDVNLQHRFNAHPLDIAMGAESFFKEWPDSYGVQSETSPLSQARGIATLPGGVPLFKVVTDVAGNVQQRANKTPSLPDVNLVGGIGVFFPGPDGFATHEQGFVPKALNNNVKQTEFQRNNAARVLESEFIALAASAGANLPTLGVTGVAGTTFFKRDFGEFNKQLTPLPNFVALSGRIDLVGITLEIYGPTPNQSNPNPGIDQLIALGRSLGPLGVSSGVDVKVTPTEKYLAGQAVPQEWLVVPHDASDGSLSAEQVESMILNAIAEAKVTRAAIRLDIDNGFKPGARTSMVIAVADTNGELLGLYRMPDATIFSIDVAIAKARNTAYYADASAIVEADRIDFNRDGILGGVTTSPNSGGDTLPLGTALTNRTFRFLVEPRYPTGAEFPNANLAPQSILIMPGIDPLTAENTGKPLPFSVYADPTAKSTTAFDAFVPSRNFRDPGDASVKIGDTGKVFPTANQNGVVFFPGSSSLYIGGKLVGGLGVSGDGVDQDDVVTGAGQAGFEAPQSLRADQYFIGGVRLPYQKYNRNPGGK